jgi:hypothetical protein
MLKNIHEFRQFYEEKEKFSNCKNSRFKNPKFSGGGGGGGDSIFSQAFLMKIKRKIIFGEIRTLTLREREFHRLTAAVGAEI